MTSVRRMKRKVAPSRSGPLPELTDLLPLHTLLQVVRGVETLLKSTQVPPGHWALIDPNGNMTSHPDILTLFIDAKHIYKPKA